MLRRLGLTIALLIAAASVAIAQAPPPFTDVKAIPDTPAYRRAQEMLDLVNGFEAGKARAYVTENFAPEFRDDAPMSAHLDVLRTAHANGRLTAHSARRYDPPRPETNAVLVVWNEDYESWQAIVVTVEPEAPYRIANFTVSGARTPSNVPAARAMADAEVAKKVAAAVERLTAKGLFSGTVLLARDGKPFLTRATGIANRDFGAPNQLDTKFNLGSMNKMFTGVAVMQLVEAGKLSLDDPVSKYLGEDWLPKSILDRVQVKHLLTHTSGLGSYFNEAYVRSSRELFRDVNDYQSLVHGDSLTFAPGTRWSYSNTGMLLAGAVIEKASGQDYFTYVREHVTGPAGMTRTDCYSLDEVNSGLAVGYERRVTDSGVIYRNNLYQHVMRGGPAGGGYSTVGDLLKFDQALRGGKLVKPESTKQLWRAWTEIGSPEYGLGFFVGATPLGRRVGHSGGFNGINSELRMYLDGGYTVAVMANQGGAATPVADLASRLIEAGKTAAAVARQ